MPGPIHGPSSQPSAPPPGFGPRGGLTPGKQISVTSTPQADEDKPKIVKFEGSTSLAEPSGPAPSSKETYSYASTPWCDHPRERIVINDLGVHCERYIRTFIEYPVKLSKEQPQTTKPPSEELQQAG